MKLTTPLKDTDVEKLKIGDKVLLSGIILPGLKSAGSSCFDPVGIYDEVYITEPPANTYSISSYPEYMKPNTFTFAPGDIVNFHADFTT